jgi:hypothetical protein
MNTSKAEMHMQRALGLQSTTKGFGRNAFGNERQSISGIISLNQRFKTLS